MTRAVLEAYGLVNDFYITTELLTWAIQEAIESPKYVLLFCLLKWFTVACKYDFSNNRQAVTVQAAPYLDRVWED